MRAFVINLDVATDRWAFVQKSFAQSRLTLHRVPAIDGRNFTFCARDCSERRYRLLHGRTFNPRELACYLSHLEAIEAFLSHNDTHAMIAEDDILLRPDFNPVLDAALRCSSDWNILRLTGLSSRHTLRARRLYENYWLCANFGRLKGAGAYLIDRRAASALLSRLLPMHLPFDHAIDREWSLGLRAACIQPFPVSQIDSDFLSSVQPGTYPRLSRTRRCLTTYPYQAFNELSRWLFRACYYLRLLRRSPRRI